ncbi:hypothetical protein BH10BAC3_BH10BAC3_36590 [soil metagenome]
MTTDYNLEFLRNKIAQTGSALCNFYLPGFANSSYIIHTSKVDEYGNICFSLIDNLPATTNEDLQSFGLKLFFYKKGLGYHLNIEASASATHSSDSEESSTGLVHDMLFVKAKILSAEYSEGFKEKAAHPGFFYSFRKKVTQMAAGVF